MKTMDEVAKNFIVLAYQHGMSVILIDRFLRETNYDSSVVIIHETLWSSNIYPDDYNCSFESLIWRRYLTNIFDSLGEATLEECKHIALQEAKYYFDIGDKNFTKYWHDYTDFTKQITFPLDPDQIIHAVHYFGFTFTRLSSRLNKNNIACTPSDLSNIYRVKFEESNFTKEESKLRPKSVASPALKDFWRYSHEIGKSVPTILGWTEVFAGTNATVHDIMFALTNPYD